VAPEVSAAVSSQSQSEAVVLLHGFAGTAHAFEDVCAALPPERCRSLALDLPGHGSAAADVPTDFERAVAYVLARSPERFVLCGYSQGGRIALHVALRAPERVSRLVLVSASPGIEDDAERAARAQADERLASEIERDGIDAFVTRWRGQPLFADEPAEVRATASADHRRNSTAGLAAALHGLGAGAMEPVWDRLGELAMPVTVLAGERDAKYTAIAQRIATLVRGCELRIVAGGHGLLLENPAAVSAAILGDCAREADAAANARGPAQSGSTPSPGPSGTAISPSSAGSRPLRPLSSESVARPDGASGPRAASAAAACTAPAIPSGPS
jgi:2-succinyl-6-hydroxy-2,4-cyclohexadiene-1-carboxylate synthase